jgi:hypothetical protein
MCQRVLLAWCSFTLQRLNNVDAIQSTVSPLLFDGAAAVPHFCTVSPK